MSRDVLDPLQRLYLALDDTIDVNTSQILVVDSPPSRASARRAARPSAPHDSILYPPSSAAGRYLNGIYRSAALPDVKAELLLPVRGIVGARGGAAFSADRSAGV